MNDGNILPDPRRDPGFPGYALAGGRVINRENAQRMVVRCTSPGVQYSSCCCSSQPAASRQT
jgi:hypothetical protein